MADDYRDEMDALNSDEVEAALSHRAARGARAEGLVADLRRALREEPSPEVARAHVEAMLAASAARSERRSTMRGVTTRRIGGVALAAVLTLGGTLAAAVTLPPQADDEAREAVGQGSEVAAEASAHGKAVREVAQDPSLEGCEKGQAVAEVASSKAQGEPPEDVERPDPCAQAEGSAPEEGGGGRGEAGSAFGKAKAAQAREDGEALGEDTAADAQSGGADFGQDTAGQVTAGGAGSAATGQAAADDAGGTTSADEASGGAAGSAGPPAGTPGGPPGS
ncbi:MAG TPA: hypothetical protein VHH92_07175 [Actinomycetota bacterium]|nr:hypothetical protein [Actinomycetota bacterium]